MPLQENGARRFHSFFPLSLILIISDQNGHTIGKGAKKVSFCLSVWDNPIKSAF
jgi:hypothetical protein